MVKFKEFCCGCDVRTGTLIIFWTTLILDALRCLFYLAKILYDRPYYYSYEESPTATVVRDFFFLIACTIGIAVSAIGLFGLQKSRAEFVKLCYYYYLGYIAYWIFIVAIVVIFPSWYDNVAIFSPFYFYTSFNEVEEYVTVIVVGYLFVLALTWYFAMTIKSHLDNMLKSQDDIFDQEIPDPTAQGYAQSS